MELSLIILSYFKLRSVSCKPQGTHKAEPYSGYTNDKQASLKGKNTNGQTHEKALNIASCQGNAHNAGQDVGKKVP